MNVNIDAPAEMRARLASSVYGSSGFNSNVQAVLSNILDSDNDDDKNTSDERAVLDKYRSTIKKNGLISMTIPYDGKYIRNSTLRIRLHTDFCGSPSTSVASDQLFNGAGLI